MYEARREMFSYELIILQHLGFRVNITLPYAYMVNYLQVMGIVDNKNLVQRAWTHVNGLLWTVMPTTQQPNVLACAAIYLAAREEKVRMPPHWMCVVDCSEDDVSQIATQLDNFYQDWHARQFPRLYSVEAVQSYLNKNDTP